MAFTGSVYMALALNLHRDTLEQTLLNTIKHRVVLNDSEVLGLGSELLIGINTGTKHLSLGGSHLAHLLRHLACGCWAKVSQNLVKENA